MNNNFLNKKREGSGISKVYSKSKPQSLSHSIENKMHECLLGSKFRILNEKLYTISSEEAFEYFKNNPEDFDVYHQGFEIQAKKWPVNPNDLIFDELKKDKYKNKVVADLGCGEAMLAQKLNKLDNDKDKGRENYADKSQINKSRVIHSFDLIKLNDFITQCDIKNVPLGDSSVNIAVFCLSLMGVNFIDFIREAKRILVSGGILIVAEIISRVVEMKKFILIFEKLGFKLRKKIDIKNYFVLLIFRLDEGENLNSKIKKKWNKKRDISLEEVNGIDILKPCLYKKR